MIKLSELEQKQLLGFGLLALLFIFPIIQANITFADDTTRVIVGYPGWAFLGRPLATLSSIFLSLGWVEKGILDIGALGQFLAAALLALSAFQFNQYIKRDFGHSIFWLSAILIINPYFLYNLSYRFDAFAMSLGLFCTVYAFCLPHKNRIGSVKSILLLIAALSLYQSDFNLFIALAAIELLLLSADKKLPQLLQQLVIRATQYCIALIIYYLTIAKIFMASNHGRNHMISFDAEGWKNLIANINAYASRFMDFFSAPICILLGLFTIICLFHYLRYCRKQKNKWLLLLTPLIAVLMYLLSLSGPMFLLAENNAMYRTMASFYMFVALLITLSFIARKQFSYAWLIPVYIAFSISYQHGIVLKTQRDYDNSVMDMIEKDLLDAKLDTLPTYAWGSLERAPRTKNIIHSNHFIRGATSPASGWAARALLVATGLESIVFQWPDEYDAYEPTLRQDYCSATPVTLAENSRYSIYHSNNTNLILLGTDLKRYC